MEPSSQSPEQLPVPSNPEVAQDEPQLAEHGERYAAQRERLGGLVANAERLPSMERQRQPAGPAPTATTLPAPQPSAASTTTADPAAATDDTPLVAADEDLIEKEWVDKAKRVLAETKDDPYRREQEVKKLQLEYVRKRYGREIGSSGG